MYFRFMLYSIFIRRRLLNNSRKIMSSFNILSQRTFFFMLVFYYILSWLCASILKAFILFLFLLFWRRMNILAFLFLGLLPCVASADFKGKSQVEINEVVSSRRFFFWAPRGSRTFWKKKNVKGISLPGRKDLVKVNQSIEFEGFPPI